jgi:NADP-dependent 3-hydroxy acid dehydrogenase YdfG
VFLANTTDHLTEEIKPERAYLSRRLVVQLHIGPLPAVSWAEVRERFRTLNVLVDNAEIQRVEDLTSGDSPDAEATINTDLLGPMRLTAALIHQLIAQSQGSDSKCVVGAR